MIGNIMVNDLTIAIFGENLNVAIPFKDALSILQKLDLIHVGNLAEQAVSRKIGVALSTRCNTGYDLENGWEIKHGQTTQHSQTRSAWVAGLKNKTGTLRIIITEQITMKQYYFKVPYCAYKDFSNSTLRWSFDLDGTPRKIPKRPKLCTRPNYWDYEVESFEKLCS
jgi:hypothetical protein